MYAVQVTTGGTYTITQTNGVTDLELWIYDAGGTVIGTIDEEWGGAPEIGSASVPIGTYRIEVYNNGAAFGVGNQDGPFTLTVTGPS